MRKTIVSLAILSLMLAATCAMPVGIKLVSAGEFTDTGGQLHAWKINGGHTLVWDGKPYLPVGGVFYSRYICLEQTDANWQADQKSLELIKSKGITDLILKSIGPATWTRPEAWQKLIDYLDTNGFTYGIDLSDGPKSPLAGYIIEPTRYRMPDITREATFTFDIPDAVTSMWMLCSASSGAVLSSGGGSLVDGKIKVNLKSSPGETSVLLVFPKKEFSGGLDRSGIADLWTGFDEYRDNLVKFAGSLKFGKGLRFFVDPLASKMDLTGEQASLIPDSPGFRLEFESFLAKKYLNIGSINSAWSVKAADLQSFQQAARLIPLWRGTKGVPSLFDPASGKRINVDPSSSTFWNDLTRFRDQSAQTYMNAAADIVKRHAANVPVIYKATSHHQVFANSVSRGGFDGLGVDAYGRGVDLVTTSAGPAYSLAEESARSMWFVATGTTDARSKDKPGYASETAMIGDLDTLREIGVKGVFVRALQMLPDDKDKKNSLIMIPEQLDWLKRFKDRFQSDDRADYTPVVISYPVQPIVGASITRLGPGEWWLPSLRPGASVDFGETIGAYIAANLDGICIWSRSGPTTLTFPLIDKDPPVLAFPTDKGDILSVNQKKKLAVLNLGSTPVVVTGLDPGQSFPVETAQAAIDKLMAVMAKAKVSGTASGPTDKTVESAVDVLKNGRARTAYDMAMLNATELDNDIGTYSWIEGENVASHSFDGVKSASGASGGAYLSLDQSVAPPVSNYAVAYGLVATKEATHQLWIACTTKEAGASPFSFSVDGGPWQQAALAPGAAPYTQDLAWYMIGSANLSKGPHLLQIRIDEPNASGAYRLDIDAVVLSPSEFKPKGIVKP